MRNPGFLVPTILFPMMLYSFFGAALPPAGLYSQMAIASFSVYAVVGVAFYQFGAGIAQDREDPFYSWMKTLPASSRPNALAQIFSAMLLAIAAVLLVLLASRLFGKTQLSLQATIALLGVCVLIAVPASLMGIALGYATSAKAATALANLIFLPLAFLGGLWIPPIAMPNTVAEISVWTPTRAMGEFAWGAVAGVMPDSKYIFSLGAYTVGLLLLIIFLIKRDNAKRFG